MTDLFEFNLISDRTSTKTRRTYSQRNVSSLQLELTKNRKMINVKTSKTTTTTTTMLNRTMSFRPLSDTSSSLTNVENTPLKKISKESNTSIVTSSSQEIVEETPMKEEENENAMITSEKMARDIQRLAIRLRSSIPLYDIPVYDNQATKPATLHLSQVVNRVSRCNYVLRRFVREAEKYSLKPVLSLPSHEKGRRRLFVDSPTQQTINSNSENQPPPTTPRKASGVIKQLFASPSSSFKRTSSSTSSSNTSLIINDKRQKLF